MLVSNGPDRNNNLVVNGSRIIKKSADNDFDFFYYPFFERKDIFSLRGILDRVSIRNICVFMRI